MDNPVFEIEQVLLTISEARRWDTVILGCRALCKIRGMVKQSEDERSKWATANNATTEQIKTLGVKKLV